MEEAEILFRQAVEHHTAGRLHEASTAYQQVLALRPAHAPTLHLLGAIAYQLDRSDIAVNLMEAAVRIDGEAAAFHNDLGEVYRTLGRRAEAACEFQRALALAPDLASAHNNLAILMQGERQFEAAIALYRRAAILMPDSADVRMNLGCALLETGETEAAVAALEEARGLAPEDPVVALNLGNARLAQDRPEEAAALYREALGRKPGYVLAEVNLGRALRELGRPEEALGHYRRAVAQAPDLAVARWNEGSCRLLLGGLAEGWQGFAWRWRAGAVPPHGLAAPEWDGSPLAGRRLLVHAEQGLGDTIQFVRFLPLLARRGAGAVALLCQKPLARLLAGAAETVVEPGATLPPHDLRVPLLDLPRLLGIGLGDLPGAMPCLAADPDATAAWRERLGGGAARRVGLVWRGRPDHANDRRRSLAAAALAPLLAEPGVAWFSLQKPAPAMLPTGIVDLAPALGDMADTAAAIMALDLVITVDTAVAHLAGALGRPVWVLLPFAPDWRWLTGRADSPWYPSVRLFRQPGRGDWAGAIAAVAAALRAWASPSAGT